MVPIYYVLISLPCTLGAIALAIFHIYRHLMNYTEPVYQRYIVRIVFMVPVYALMSFLSLIMRDRSIYFNSLREIYEAWVIYNFLSLCLAWVGGPGAVVISLNGRVLKPSVCLMTCCFPPIPLDGRFIRRCKQGCLQFVILKPVLVAVTFILYAKGKYEDGDFSANRSYLYLTIIYTISYTVALYALVLFYVACRDLLQPFNPVPKFVLIKSVVFLTYWQGVLVFLAAKSGFIDDAEDAADFQNLIICVEMLMAAVGHFFAFPYKEYSGANIGVSPGFSTSLAHALMLNDFYHDTVHQMHNVNFPFEIKLAFIEAVLLSCLCGTDRANLYPFTYCDLNQLWYNTPGLPTHRDPISDSFEFAPTYHEYVLYNHGDGEEAGRKYRSRTFVPTGQEMVDAARRNMHGNKLDEIQLPSQSSSETSTPKNPLAGQTSISESGIKSPSPPPLVDTSNSLSVPYEYDTTLTDIDLSNYPSDVPAVNEMSDR
ncbi:hypothetical protein Cgig2_029702 [Carnegiea gigantea]|uniref:Transmembrane protein 184A n=1 Tax=Carnegiea gigantea TaxID=171969 RepID=A0A9Q1KIS7_9CARY|nr:hypothetical protein Cgig2_029702 [Carnegiea gigantea]